MKYTCLKKCSFLIFISFFLLTVALSPARAQHTLKGQVSEKISGERMGDVQVYIYELGKGTVTDSNGNYEFNNLSAGTVTLAFNYIGYRQVTPKVEVKPEAVTRFSIQLETVTLQNEPVFITSTRIQDTKQIPLNTSIISEEELSEAGSATLWSSLQQMSRISLQTNGPGIERPMIRGLTTDRIKIINQDVEYSYQTWDPESGLGMNGNGAEQIQLIRGPATLQYGPGAMGGVIELVPGRHAPAGQTVGHYQLGLFSNTTGVNNELAIKGAREGWFWGFNGSFDSHADYEPGGKGVEGEAEGEENDLEGEIRNSRYNNAQLRLNGGINRSWGKTSLTYEFLQHKNGIVENESGESGEPEEEKGRKIERPYHDLTDHILVSKTDWYRGDSHLNLTLGLQQNRQQEFEGEGESAEESREEEAAMDLVLSSFNYEASLNQQLNPSLTLSAGLDGDAKVNESKGEEAFVPHADLFDLGTFTLLDWQATDGLSVQAGARYDLNSIRSRPSEEEGEREGEPEDRQFGVDERVDRTLSNFSGSLGLAYRPAPKLTIKANAGIGYRTPNLAELTADGLLREIRRYQVGDNDLKAENNLEFDLGLEYTGEEITVHADGFYNRINQFIFQEFAGTVSLPSRNDPSTSETYNAFRFRQQDAGLYGGETGISLHPSLLPWVQLNSRFILTIGSFSSGGDPLPMMPAPNWNNSVRVSKAALGPFKNLKLTLALRKYFKQKREASFETETPGYLLTDVQIGGELPFAGRFLRLNLSVNNLTDERYISHLSLLKFEGIPNIGRNISLTARIPFGL